MALTFGFYDSINGDRTYNAKDFSRFFDGILTDGVFGDIGDALKVTAGSGLSVNVGIGRAWFNRTWTWNDSVLNLPLPTADATLPRIDSVVLIIDDPLRTNSIEVIEGTPASSPVPPTLTNTGDHHEYRLANVAVAATATSITNSNITNFVGTDDVPYVTVNASTLFFPNLTMPVMDGTAAIGTKKEYARSDHRHPTDTSRAPVASPAFTGTPTAPTAAASVNTTQIATTAFVQTVVANTASAKANLASPTFTGTPKAPTAAAGTNTTQIATTAFVKTAIDNAKSSIALTGTPTAPTAAAGTNTTQIATTAFVKTAIDNISPNTLRVYRQTTGYNGDYPLLVSRTLAANIGTSGTNGSSANVYGVMWNDTTKVPTINPSTGRMKVPGEIDASLNGTVTGVLVSSSLGVQLYHSDMVPSDYDVKLGAFGIVLSNASDGRQHKIIGWNGLDLASALSTGDLTANSVVMTGANADAKLTTRTVRNNTVTSQAVTADTALITSNTLKNALNRATSVAAADTSYTSVMARGIALYASTATPSITTSGALAFTYE